MKMSIKLNTNQVKVGDTMSKIIQIIISALIVIGVIGTILFIKNDDFDSILPHSKDATEATDQTHVYKQSPLAYHQSKQLKLHELDKQGRPVDAHIQLKYKDKPQHDRDPRLSYNPPGWHNYKMKYTKEDGSTSKYWTFNRSHLIGYLFSGLNDEPKNIITGTSHLNKGDYNGMDQDNQKSMLYYEMRLNKWLKNHPDYTLDYQVTPIYKGDELIPREVRLAYTGYNDKGQRVDIHLNSGFETEGHKATVVALPNEEPDFKFNYHNGREVK